MAVRQRRTDHDIVLAAVAGQQQHEPRQHHRMQRHPLSARQRIQRLHQRRRQRHFAVVTALVENRRPQKVQRQIELLATCQRLPPKGQFIRPALHIFRRLLPARIVKVLQRRLCRLTPRPAIARVQFLQQHLKRPAVKDDVMEHQQAHGRFPLRRIAVTVARGAQRQLARQIHRLAAGLRQRSVKFIGAQRQQRYRQHGVADPLTGFAPVILADQAAQDLVALDDRLQTRRKAFVIDIRRQPQQHRRQIMRGIHRQLLNKPQPRLLKRQRRLPQPAGEDRQLIRRRLPLGGDVLAQCGHRRMLIQRQYRDLCPRQFIHFVAQPDGHNGVAAEAEEVVVHANIAPQQPVEQRRQTGLQRRARPAKRRLRLDRQRFRQCPVIDLAAHRQRQRRQRPHRRRQHVVRQLRRQALQDVAGLRLRASLRHIPSRQLVRSAGTQTHHRLGHLRQRTQLHFYFAQFDAIAVDLDLLIVPPEILQTAVGQAPHSVTGAIQAPVRFPQFKWVGDERGRRQRRQVQVSPRQPHAGQAQLAFYAQR